MTTKMQRRIQKRLDRTCDICGVEGTYVFDSRMWNNNNTAKVCPACLIKAMWAERRIEGAR